MVRFWLRDDQFDRIEALLPGKRSDPGRTAANNRLFVEAVLWIARTGSDVARSPAGIRSLIVPTSVLPVGRARASGIDSSRNWPVTPILKRFLSTARLCRAHQHAAGAAKKAAIKRSDDPVAD